MIAPTLGFFSFLGFFAWLALIAFGHAMAGMGDGSSSSEADGVLEFSGALYLSLVFLSCLPFIQGKLLVATGIVAHVSLMVLAAVVLSDVGFAGFIVLIPFFIFAAGWYALYKSRTISIE